MSSGEQRGAHGRDLVLGCDPLGRSNPRLVVALARAGALGVLDLGHADDVEALGLVARRTEAPVAVRVLRPADVSAAVASLTGAALRVDTVVVPAGSSADDLSSARAAGSAGSSRRVLVEVTGIEQARAAVAVGADGLVARGREAGGPVGEVEAFVLLQQVVGLGVPVWLAGGIGGSTAAAAVAAGATGVVLDSQLALVRECELDEATRLAVAAMDGSETRVVGGFRFYVRPDLPSASVPDDAPAAEVAARLGASIHHDLVPLGQDAAFAGPLAERHVTAGGVVAAVREAVREGIDAARATRPLAPGNGVASVLGTRVPVAQGPMTRVSDRAGFAAAVAEGGGLPFLALALLRGDEVRRLLEETAGLLGDRPWGVGILGFVPPELRDEQLAVVRDVRPPVALIAGGRPSQAAPLEADGIRTFLHAPSPGLVESFARAGARRFVLEGRECGGHVGPRSSFVLWESAVERLGRLDDVSDLEVLFAGGIHDARSAAAVAALAGPLAERGAHVGVLMGTGYLFTAEAVAHGAITPTFQDAALACERTLLVETAPGHATRCADSPFVAAFAAARARLEAAGATPQEVWGELEAMNLGRLRIASKGLVREGDELRGVDADAVRREGMFMLGQVATLRSEVTTVDALHEEVTAGATRLLADEDVVPRIGRVVERDRPRRLDVAVVGMAAVLPGARDVEEFWANVLAGADAVTEVPPSRWDVERYYDPAATTVGAGRRTPSKWGGFLPAVGFDALAYGIPPTSLASVDPVQLLALEVASRALADAGYATRPFDRSRASVVFGAEAGTDLSAAYGLRSVLPAYLPHRPGEEALPAELDAHLPVLTEDSFPGVLTNVLAGRIANRLDLGGVNYTVDAACAASLAALDLACKELVSGASDLVLCGGADTHNGINDYLLFSSVHALSPSGRCATFDESADGIALGEGVACVVLKRLDDAERDGDRVYAVIEAVSGSSDGRALGLTAPRADGQRRALERAYAMAGRSPSEVGLVEAHGTGTVVGDATELATLTEVYVAHGASPGAAVLGSVKSQIGHTKCAAGLAGLIKTAQALHRGVLPPTLHLRQPNASWDEAKSPFRFTERPRPWAAEERRAAVSAFGFGGANFHAVLRSHDDDGPRHGLEAWPAELFVVRAPDRAAALERVARLAATVAEVLDVDPEAERHRLRDLAATVAAEGSGPVQVALVADDLAHLARALDGVLAGTAGARDGVFTRVEDAPDDPPPVTFLLPGQGSQRVGMLEDLLVAFPFLRAHLVDDEVAARVYPPQAFGREAREDQRAALTDTRVAQPALGVADVVLADLLGRVGVRPAALAGHSYGELVALALGGAYDLDVLRDLSRARGEAVHDAAARAEDPGGMVAVAATREELAEVLEAHPGVVLANHNAPRQCALAGTTPAIEALEADLAARGLRAKRLPVACAFHSPVVAGARDALAARLAEVELGAPTLPVWSNTTAARFPDDPDELAELLARQVASPVRFVDQVEAMYAAGSRVFVEVGPGRVLTGLVREVLGDRPHAAVACDVAGEHGLRRFLLALAELASLGVDVDTGPLFEGRAERLDLGALPRPRPGWLVDGHLVRTADGRPVPGGLRPATDDPVLGFGTGVGPAGDGSTAEVVGEYLRNLREAVAAERDVMLRFLGAEPGSASAPAGAVVPARAVEAVEVAGTVPGADGAPVVSGRPAAAGREELLATLLAIVARRTGYPPDMLDPDLDLEADLSIDSIKRIEIIGELAEEVGLPGASGAGIDEEVVEELARRKTLASIVDWLDALAPPATGGVPGTAGADAVGAAGAPVAPGRPAAAGREELLATLLAIVARRTGYPPDMLDPDLDLEADLSIDSIKRIEIIGELAEEVGLPGASGAGIDEEVVEELARRKTLASIVDWLVAADPAGSDGADSDASDAVHEGTDATEGDPASNVPSAALRGLVVEQPAGPRRADAPLAAPARVLVVGDGEVAGAVAEHLVAAGHEVVAGDRSAPGDPSTADAVVLVGDDRAEAPDAFEALAPAVLSGGARVLVAVPAAANGGLAGLARALRAEAPDRWIRTVRHDLRATPAEVAAELVAELAEDGPVEVVLRDGDRRAPTVVVGDRASGGTAVAPGAVVLLTGGARGITARVAERFARDGAGHLVLVGRTPAPEGPEAPDLADAPDEVAVRRALLARGGLASPAEVEAACRRVLAEREVRATLAAVEAAGAGVTYVATDVRDGVALASAVEEVVRVHGRLDGVVHGAGVIEDRVLADKTAESFRRVYETKVAGARALLHAVPDDVGFVVLFGSVSGVFGNRGQTDYAAANDALDALALAPPAGLAGRVLAVDWGPWGGSGMVSPELARAYERRGVGLIDPTDGVDALVEELAALQRDGRFPAPQVVVARARPDAFAGPRADAPAGVPG